MTLIRLRTPDEGPTIESWVKRSDIAILIYKLNIIYTAAKRGPIARCDVSCFGFIYSRAWQPCKKMSVAIKRLVDFPRIC